MSVSYTLSDIAADFGAGAKHVANKASPFLTFEFGTPPKIFKSTMVKHGGPLVAWQQPVLLTGASTSRLVITAMTHKSLLPDTTIGTGTLDLAQAAAQSGPVVVQLSGKTGASAGNVQFVVTQGQGAGMQGVRQPTPDSSGVVEGVGGQGRNIEGGQLPAGTGMTGTGQHHGGMGTGAALGAAGGAAAAGMAARHHDNNRGVDERGMGNERGMGMGNERGMGVERGMENERGMGSTGMGGMGGSSNYENSQPGMMQQQPQQEQMRGASMVGAMMPQGGQQGGMMTQGGQERGMMTQPGQQGGMMPQGGQQSGMMGGGYDNNNNNQMVPGQQQGMMQQQQGGMMGGMGNTPQETYEKHAHNVHDHDENETYERRNVG